MTRKNKLLTASVLLRLEKEGAPGSRQAATLFILDAQPGATTVEIAKWIRADRNTTNGVLLRLREKGLVNRSSRDLPGGGRAPHRFYLTAKAKDLLSPTS